MGGCSVFVDVHVANKTRRAVKRLELTLERDVLGYRHAVATPLDRHATHARVFESRQQTIIKKASMRQGVDGWAGVEAHASDTRTYELEVPRGQATVRCGKFFEVRYFLNVVASLSNSKLVAVQLPIILIHINSLDVLPNSVAQVAAAIEEKRGHGGSPSTSRGGSRPNGRQRSVSSPAQAERIRRKPSVYGQGRAFAAPRQQSLERRQAEKGELDELRRLVETSPRKHAPQLPGAYAQRNCSTFSFDVASAKGQMDDGMGEVVCRTPPSNRKARRVEAYGVREAEGLRARLRGSKSCEPGIRSRQVSVQRRQFEGQLAEPAELESVRRYYLAPHTLGLTSTSAPPDAQDEGLRENSRPATSLSFRRRADRNRFEFAGVRRKASAGGLKAKAWLEHVSGRDREDDRDMYGWI